MKKKICFAASSGGHLEEVSRLRELWGEYDCFLVTESGPFPVPPLCERAYYVPQIQRKQPFLPLRLIGLSFRSASILFHEKPDCIISTGALSTVPICLLGKLMGKKLIYIESFARVEHLSATGRLMYRFADLFFVQWESLLKDAPEAIYEGSLF